MKKVQLHKLKSKYIKYFEGMRTPHRQKVVVLTENGNNVDEASTHELADILYGNSEINAPRTFKGNTVVHIDEFFKNPIRRNPWSGESVIDGPLMNLDDVQFALLHFAYTDGDTAVPKNEPRLGKKGRRGMWGLVEEIQSLAPPWGKIKEDYQDALDGDPELVIILETANKDMYISDEQAQGPFQSDSGGVTGSPLKVLRNFMTKKFREEELREICFYKSDFREVHQRLSSKNSVSDIADILIEYAEQKQLIPELKKVLQSKNPRGYKVHFPNG